jgi:hypothetical protein
MRTRKLLLSLAVAGLLTAGFGAAVLPANADPRTITVTLLGGSQVTITVDVPPGTPLDQIKLPDFPLPVVGIEDSGSGTTTSTDTTTTPPPATPAPPPATAPPPAGTAPATKPAPPAQQQTHAAPGSATVGADATVGSDVGVSPDKPKPGGGTEFRDPNGVPTNANPGLSLALPGPAPVGVPNFFIDKFRIPPFLLPIYQAAGIQYGVRWEVLAAINEIETDYGRNLNVSTAGAVGWMQFIPSTWKRYGVDANRDGRKDPYNPVDAIFAAARYLRAAGADTDLRQAVFAYNHADWYVDSVLMRAQLIGGLPADLVGSLTGLTQGHFPVAAKARYADDLSEKQATRRVRRGQNAALVIKSNSSRRGINIYSKAGAPVIAVNDGVIKKIGTTERLGQFVMLQDVYGNRYTYAHLKKVSDVYPVPKHRTVSKAQIAKELRLPKRDPAPSAPASAGSQATSAHPSRKARTVAVPAPAQSVTDVAKQRLFANPSRPDARPAGGDDQLASKPLPASDSSTFKSYVSRVLGLSRSDVELRALKPGSRVIAGTILGRIGKTSDTVAPHLLFEVRPAGRGAPRIDPKPVLDGWKLLESTAIYRAANKNPFFGPDAKSPSIGQVLLMSKEALARQVLADPRINIYECGQRDVRAGQVDRRVLATLEFLASSGLKPTVTSLRCGHGLMTSSGNISEHSSGNAVDIAAINGIPILGHQGQGSITELTIRRLLTLQGAMKPHQIISLMTFDGADNTLALPDHADHIHVGFHPLFGDNAKLGKQLNAVLKPGQWIKLIDRIGSIKNPQVPTTPSPYSIPDTGSQTGGD